MAQLKDLIVTGASRFINGLQVNNGVVADNISATTANMNVLITTSVYGVNSNFESITFNTTTLAKGANLLTLSDTSTTYYTFRTSSFGPTSDQNENNINLGSLDYKWNNIYLKGINYTNKVESYASTGLILNGRTSTMLQLNGTNYAGIASNGNFYFYKNSIRFQKVADNGYGEIYKNHNSSADYGSWFRDIASTTNGDVIAGINIAAHPNIKIGSSLLFKRGDTNYTIYGTHNLVLSDGLTSTSNNNNVTTIKVDLDGTYNSSTNKVATISSITNAINALDVSAQTGATNKTLTSIKQVNGKIDSVTYENISITKSQVSDFPSSMPASDVSSWAKQSSKPSYSLSEITGTSDLQEIEALAGTSGFLKKTGTNDWSLDTSTYSTTDENVKQTATSGGNYNLRLLLSSHANDNTLTAGTYKSTNLYYNDNSQTLFVGKGIRVNYFTATSNITDAYAQYACLFVGTEATSASTQGVATLMLGNPGAVNTDVNNARGRILLYSTTNTYASIYNNNTSRSSTIYIPNDNTANMYLTHITGTAAVGSVSRPVYVNGNSRVVAVSCVAATYGGTGFSNYERPSDENYYYRGIAATTALPANLIPGGIVLIYGQMSEI